MIKDYRNPREYELIHKAYLAMFDPSVTLNEDASVPNPNESA